MVSCFGLLVYQERRLVSQPPLVVSFCHSEQSTDAFFPELNPDEWTEALREEHPADEKHAQAYTFIDYTRK